MGRLFCSPVFLDPVFLRLMSLGKASSAVCDFPLIGGNTALVIAALNSKA